MKKKILVIYLILIFSCLLLPNIGSEKSVIVKNKTDINFFFNKEPIERIDFLKENYRLDYPNILWWYDLYAPCFGSAASDDIDNDGNLEIVFGTYFNDEHVYALNADDGSLLWSYNTGGCNDASPVIYDVDLDGELEVIIPASSPYRIYCFDGSTGVVEWSRSTGYPNCIDSPPAVADVDNDNKPEIIFGAWYGNIFCLNGEDGSICWQIILGSDSYFQAGPNILDLDNDSQLDIVIAQYSGDCRIYALKGDDGSVLWYSELPGDYMYHGGSFADIDEDGLPEIVIGCYDNYVYVLNGEDGNLVWSYYAPYYIASPTSIADLNNDDHLEIVFTSYNYLGVLSHTGNLLWSYTASGSMFRGVSIADIDGNGILDVVFGADDGILRVLQGDNGQIIWSLDLEAHYQNIFQIDNAPIIEDFNNDGKLDIFIIGGFGSSNPPSNNHGRCYAISAGEGTGNGWPMFRHDIYHSAYFDYQNNQAPIAMKDTTFTYINESKWINVTYNDYDYDGEIDPETVEIEVYPTNGVITVDQFTGNISYIPNIGFIGKDTLNYTVCDDEGLISNECMVEIYVITIDMIFVGLNLKNNWNLITIPIENDWKASTLAENISGCQMISWFDAQNQTYKTHIVGVPGYDFDIEDGYGLFILVDQNSNLTMSGIGLSIVPVPLSVGWNMIGWYKYYDTSASNLAENISGCQMVSWFDSVNQTFKTHIVGIPGYDFTITRGMGLFILVDTASIWHGAE
jgi:outer membrane protein assembly factor BamB